MKSVENLTNIRVRFCSAFAMDDRIGAISLPNDSKKSRDKKSAAKELKKKKLIPRKYHQTEAYLKDMGMTGLASA